jgi:hypothetical protein
MKWHLVVTKWRFVVAKRLKLSDEMTDIFYKVGVIHSLKAYDNFSR